MEKDHPQTKLKELEVPSGENSHLQLKLLQMFSGPKSFVLTVRDRDELAQVAFLERRRAAVSELFKEYVSPYDVLKWPRSDDYSTVCSQRLASCKNLMNCSFIHAQYMASCGSSFRTRNELMRHTKRLLNSSCSLAFGSAQIGGPSANCLLVSMAHHELCSHLHNLKNVDTQRTWIVDV